jgi:hypothetical protein
VGSSSERLDSTLDEGPDDLDPRKLLFRSSLELLDLLHQWLRNLQLLVRKVVSARYARSKNVGGMEFLESEVFAVGGFVLGIVPLRLPPGIVFGRLEVEIFNVWAHLNAKTVGLIRQRVPNNKDSAPQRPVGFNPQEALTERDKARNVKDGIGIQVMELNPISKKKTAEERMRGKRQTPQQEGDEDYPESRRWPGKDLRAGGERLHRRVLQEAHLLGLGQLLVPDLGLDPAANGGSVGIGRLGLLGGGASGSGTPLAHDLRALQGLRKWS